MTGESLPLRGAWIEIVMVFCLCYPWVSLPLRGAWIEIVELIQQAENLEVAPPAGSVD